MTTTTAQTTRTGADAEIRPLEEADLPAADAVLRQAFGAFLGMPDPFGDTDYVRSRWRAAPDAAWVAELDGEVVGSTFTARWGSFGFFGPVSVRPDLWNRGIGQRLLKPTTARLAEWGVRQVGLFTFAHSPKHVALYQRAGFWPQQLTVVAAAGVSPSHPAPSWSAFGQLSSSAQEQARDACRALTDRVFPGLDLTHEIDAVHAQQLGDTVLVDGGTGLEGVAVCHVGAGSEAGSGHCYIKFGAVRPGPNAASQFARLVAACHHYAAAREANVLVAGTNLAREGAARSLTDLGFRTQLQGVAMQSPNQPGYNRPDAYVIDDLR
jgi:predicted N-acetyltransferase YhbS